VQTAKERAKLISQVNELFTNYFDFQSFIDQDKKFTKDTKDTEITAAILLEQSFTNVMLFLQTIDEDCVAEKDANGIKSSWNEKLFASTMYFANFLKPSPKTKAKTKPKPKPGPGLIGFFKRVLNKKLIKMILLEELLIRMNVILFIIINFLMSYRVYFLCLYATANQ